MAPIPLEIIYPGSFLDLPDKKVAFEVAGLLNTAESSLIDAALALGEFAACPVPLTAEAQEAWHVGSTRRQQAESIVKLELGIGDHDFSRYDEIRLEVDRRLLRERFEAGQLPRGCLHRRPFVHAKAFLYALDGFRNVLAHLAKREIAPQIKLLLSEIDANLPALAGVRDSTAHADERVQGLVRGRPIALKPIQNRLISAPGGAMVIECLNGENFACTLADGSYGEVPVTRGSLQLCVDVMQRLLGALPWRGPPRIAPSL